MKTRSGQVALYLVMVLVAICILVVMNVSAFLSVRAKNRAMNAGDSAALAVAKQQGELLNDIGRCNLEHLKAALEDAEEECEEVMINQARICFLRPLDFITTANEMAKQNGITVPDEFAAEVLKQHVVDIRQWYVNNPDQFPAPWEGVNDRGETAWQEYARILESKIDEGLYASPDNIDFIDAAGGHMLLNYQFYNAIAGQNWCWFHFNASGLLDAYSSFKDWGPLPSASDSTRRRRCVNSEIYSLHLEARTGSAVQLFGKKLIAELTGCSMDDIAKSTMITNQSQVWYCYSSELWRKWWEIDPDGEWRFPVVGKVRPEYDVRGCAACCRVRIDVADILSNNDEETRVVNWTGAAKPFGSVETAEEGITVVTALNRLVVPSFTETRLVPWDSVGGRDTVRPNLDMVFHVRNHLPNYLLNGPGAIESGCYYCAQLKRWESESLRSTARNWLKYNSKNCVRSLGSGTHHGGTPHGH